MKPPLEGPAQALAALLAPQDPGGEGVRKVAWCLEELIQTVKRRSRAS
jgi:hypothetical protein